MICCSFIDNLVVIYLHIIPYLINDCLCVRKISKSKIETTTEILSKIHIEKLFPIFESRTSLSFFILLAVRIHVSNQLS